MAQKVEEDTHTSLEKIKKRLSSASSSCLMEGTLLKRSETLRKWNQRWFTLDPTTGRMEYRVHQGDASPRGLIFFEPDSTITLSPINFHGVRKYDGCCFFVGTAQKKEYYLCAETPTIARAWVSSLRAASLVLKAHKEAVDSLSGNGHAKLGTVAAVVAAANATAREGMKEVQQSMAAAMKPVLSISSSNSDAVVDDVSMVMKETLRVKDEELTQVARDLRARDYMIKEMADRLSETAEAAEAAASAARAMEKERKLAQAELEDMKKVFDDRLYHAVCEVRAGDERLAAALKAREIALQEAQRWRVELGKGREQIVMMEAAVVRAEDSARRAAADGEEKVKAVKANELAALAAKEEAIDGARQWQARAEYYQEQAARYLGKLQQTGAITDGTSKVDDTVLEVNEKPSHEGAADDQAKTTTGPAEKAFPEPDIAALRLDEQTSNSAPAVEQLYGGQPPHEAVTPQAARLSNSEEEASATARKSETIDPSTTSAPVPSSTAAPAPAFTPSSPSSSPAPPPSAPPPAPALTPTPTPASTPDTTPTFAPGPAPTLTPAPDPTHAPAPTPRYPMIPQGLSSESEKNLTYITAVDFEQLQVDTYHVQRPPVAPDQVSDLPADGGSLGSHSPQNEMHLVSTASAQSLPGENGSIESHEQPGT